jgi:formiminotetrahydrofolate cyclodeaminase
MSLITLPQYLKQPTQELLDGFGAGGHKPGSGSAAALLGVVSCKMMKTVITVTRRNSKRISRYATNLPELEHIGGILEKQNEPYFTSAVQRDVELFHRYRQLASLYNRKAGLRVRKQSKRRSLRALEPATELPLKIAEHALDTARKGFLVFELGAVHVRGDSGVAISAALSSCSGALFIVYLNLRRFRGSKWAREIREAADSIAEQCRQLQIDQFRLVSRMQAEVNRRTRVRTPQMELEMEIEELEDNELF